MILCQTSNYIKGSYDVEPLFERELHIGGVKNLLVFVLKQSMAYIRLDIPRVFSSKFSCFINRHWCKIDTRKFLPINDVTRIVRRHLKHTVLPKLLIETKLPL